MSLYVLVLALKFLYYEIEFASISFNKLLFNWDVWLYDELFEIEFDVLFYIYFFGCVFIEIIEDEDVEVRFYTDADKIGCLFTFGWFNLWLEFNYGLKTFYWVNIFVWVTFPVTSFLFLGGTYLVGFIDLRFGSFDLLAVGIGGFFYITG